MDRVFPAMATSVHCDDTNRGVVFESADAKRVGEDQVLISRQGTYRKGIVSG